MGLGPRRPGKDAVRRLRANDRPTGKITMADMSRYQLDTSSFAVGEKLRVRVTPADRNGVRVTCDENASSCVADSCLTAMCQAWMTWDLELR